MRIKNIFFLLGFFAMSVISCKNNENKDTAAKEPEYTKVSVTKAKKQLVEHTGKYAATVQAYSVNNIVPIVGVRMDMIKAEVGTPVKAGQILIVSEPLKLEQVELKLKRDKKELERMKILYGQGSISDSDYEASELAYKISEKNYRELEQNTYVRTPISGVVTAKNFEQGDIYSGGLPVLVVQQINPLKILVSVSERNYSIIRPGNEVEIKIDAIPDKIFKGTVKIIYPTVDPVTHTFISEILVNNDNGLIKPGMYANVTFNMGTSDSVVIPDKAVIGRLGSADSYVFILEKDSTVRMQTVLLGKHFDRYYEILSGIEEGDIVLTEGINNLKNKEKVQVVD